MAAKKSPWERVRELTSWHSLSGYLVYKSSGPLGKLKGSTRLWFILEDSSSLLLYYKNKEEATRLKEPRGKIPLQGAGITLDPKQVNQFIVICGEKEHFFLADNHESMMVWLMGLQAKRDFFLNKRLGISSQTDPNKEPIQEEYEVIPTPPNEEGKSDKSPPSDNTIQNKEQDPQTSPIIQKTKLAFSDTVRSLTTSTLDLYRRQRNQNQWRQQRLRKILGESMDGGLDLYRDQEYVFEDLKTGTTGRDIFSIQNFNRKQSLYNSTGNLVVSEDNVFLADSVFSADEALVTKTTSEDRDPAKSAMIQKACSEGMDVNRGTIGGMFRDTQRRSGSGRSGSSDSLLDRNSENELISQLNELEQQLINTKCEMAVLMNRETCFKEVLERRDSIIIELDEKLEELSRRKEESQKHLDKKLKEEMRQLQNQNRFLNEEVRRLTQLRQKEYDNMQSHNVRVQELLATIEKWKRDYVYLLQSCISIPTGDIVDGMEVNLFGGSRHKARVKELLEECRQTNPCLPIYERLARSEVHIDQYGFKHTYPSEQLLLHYICQQLHTHYQCRLESWDEHQKQWKTLLRKSSIRLKKTKELKLLCRRGIPDHYRAEVWKKLVYEQVADIVEEKGPHYYNHLVNVAYDSQYAGRYRKQIMLDLLRTMPSNVNFNSKESEGIMRMAEVLQAFCMHNPDIGYCQGLNFIVGMCLLFLDTEDAFWTLVAITEKYFSPNYFDKTLTGAQADQEVLKDILRDKLPQIAEHLDNIDIELSTVTFNWFLAVFFDAVPFQTLIRIWDCFLAEGPKVLFRFSLAIIKMNQAGILAKKDTINVMRHLKVCGKLMFDTDGLVEVAFTDLKPFPHRKDIAAKQVVYLNALKEKLKKREVYRSALEEKNRMLDELDMIPSSALVYECAASCGNDLAWICVGEQNYGKVVSVLSTEALARDTKLEVESHILSACCLEGEIFLIGTLSRILHAYSIKMVRELWCLTLNDSIFSLCVMMSDYTNRLFAGMGDGTVAIIDQIQPKEPQEEPFYIPLGRSPVTGIVCTGNQVWMACGNAIHVLQSQSLDMLDKIMISTNPFDHVLMLADSTHGIWTTIKGSSIIELWDSELMTCKLLYDVSANKIVPRKSEDDGTLNKHRITTLLPFNNMLWVGTGDGLLTVYTIQDRSQLRHTTANFPGTHSLREGATIGAGKQCRQKHRPQHAENGKMKESKANRRLNREQSRSHEMLLNGMLEDDDDDYEVGKDPVDVDAVEEERRAKPRIRERADRSGEVRQARLARRLRLQEMRSATVRVNVKGIPATPSGTSGSKPSESAKVVTAVASATKSATPGKHEASVALEKPATQTTSATPRKSAVPQTPATQKVGTTSKDAKASTCKAGRTTNDVRSHGDTAHPRNKGKSLRTSRLQRQKGLSMNGVSCTSGKERPPLQGNGNSEPTKSEAPKSGSAKEQSCQRSGSSGIPKELLREDSIHDEVFHPVNGTSSSNSNSNSSSGRKQMTSAIMDGHTASDDRIEPQPQGTDPNHVDSKIKNQLPHVFKNVLGKAHAPPEESTVTAACSRPTSTSGSQTEESDVQCTLKGLIQDRNAEIMERKAQIPAKVIQGKVGVVRTGKNKPSSTSIGSTSGTSTSKGSSSAMTVVSMGMVSENDAMSATVPEIEIDQYDGGQFLKNMSRSLDVLDQSEGLNSGCAPRLGISSTDLVFGGSTPDLSRRGLKPPPARRRLDGTGSSSTISSSSFSDLTYFIELNVQTKVKVSDRPVKCLVPISSNGSTVILSCAGCYGDDEAVLKWTKKAGESIWTNEPVPEVCPYTNLPRRPSYMKHLAVERSLST